MPLRQVLAHISLMRPGDSAPPSSAPRPQPPSLLLGSRPPAAAPIRLASEPDASADLMSRGRPHFSDDSSSGGSFNRSRQAEEAAARARSLSNESQLNSRPVPRQDADGDVSGGGVRRPSAVPSGDGSSSMRVVQHVAPPSAPESLAVFEKPLLAALSGDDVGGIPAAEVRDRQILPPPPHSYCYCDHRIQDSTDPYMARASYYERLGRAARKYREGLSKDTLDSGQ